ncbi:MAG: methyltransferase domain-containing protein [Marinobacter sp.]|uniref:putative RNA methyltransferase n=1 Tax=Marinobacter sp. TaxID=50741 RepID=UPI0034A04BC0
MNITPFQSLACPLDGDPMRREGASWRCAAGHTFDVARQGYTHLLPVQKKRSLDPGDSKAMVLARQRFLNGGHYQPIAAAVNRLSLADLPDSSSYSCLDAGCGEGYYLRQLALHVGSEEAASEKSMALVGLDISKAAILSATRQAGSDKARQPNWLVGSNANLPMLAGSLDRVLCLFGFPVYAEFARVLKPGGRVIQVDAGPDHLRELREIIYPELKPERKQEAEAPDNFVRGATDTLRYNLDLNAAEPIADLLAMTPHLYRANAKGRDRAAALNSLAVTVDIRLTTFERIGAL